MVVFRVYYRLIIAQVSIFLTQIYENILFSPRERMSEGQVRARVILKNENVLRRIIIILSKAFSLIRPSATLPTGRQASP